LGVIEVPIEARIVVVEEGSRGAKSVGFAKNAPTIIFAQTAKKKQHLLLLPLALM